MLVRTRLIAAAAFLVTAFVAVILFAQYNLSAIGALVASIYDDRMVPLTQLKAISDAYAVNIIDTVNKAQTGTLDKSTALAAVANARQTIDREWQAYLTTYLTEQESRLVAQATQQFIIADRAIGRLQHVLQQTEGPLAGKLAEFDGPLYQQIDPVTGTLAKLITLQLDVAKAARGQVQQRHQQVSLVFLVTGLLLTLLMLMALVLLWQQYRSRRRVAALKLAKQHLQKFNAELEQQVSQRGEELRQAVNELESFHFVVSNDLQAPVRHANSYLEILRDEISEVGHRDWLELVNRAARAMDRMSQMIGDMLALSRLGRDVLQLESVNLTRLVAELLQQLPVEIRQRYRFDVDDLPVVFADKVLMRQLLQNLLDNAIKYCAPVQQPQVAITCERDDRGRTTVVVRDNGVGFDPAYAKQLFRLFQRLHKQEEFPGAGVGLALCAKIIHLHGGRIWANARPGQGASFHFSLPAMATASQVA